MYQALDGCVIEVTTVGELLLGQPKGRGSTNSTTCSCLIYTYKYGNGLCTSTLI